VDCVFDCNGLRVFFWNFRRDEQRELIVIFFLRLVGLVRFWVCSSFERLGGGVSVCER